MMTPRVVLTVVGGVDDVGVVQLPSFLKLLNCTNTQRHPTHSSQQKLPTITGLKAGMMLTQHTVCTGTCTSGTAPLWLQLTNAAGVLRMGPAVQPVNHLSHWLLGLRLYRCSRLLATLL